MGTPSTIGLRHINGIIDSINCHWDGYLSNNGYILENFYETADKVNQLIKLGDLSSLGYMGIYPEKITPEMESESIRGDMRLLDYIKSYARDFDDDKILRHFDSKEEFLKHPFDDIYLFEESENKWYYIHNNRSIPLKDALEQNMKEEPDSYHTWKKAKLPEGYDQFAALTVKETAKTKTSNTESNVDPLEQAMQNDDFWIELPNTSIGLLILHGKNSNSIADNNCYEVSHPINEDKDISVTFFKTYVNLKKWLNKTYGNGFYEQIVKLYENQLDK